MSDAFRAAPPRHRSRDWRTTTVLLVSHEWDPARHGAEALAGRRLARCLLDAGARVHVLASGRADDEIQHARYAVTAVSGGGFPASRTGRAIAMMRSGIPEAAGQWLTPAVAAGITVVRSLPRDTVIYGRAAPGTSNIVAWHLARSTGRPFVAHFSDNWPSFQLQANGRRFLAPYKWPLFRRWRRRIFTDAGALTFTNPAQAHATLGDHAPRCATKAFVVTHLPSRQAVRRSPQYERFHLVHTGNLYAPHHSAEALLRGLRLFLDRTPAAEPVVRFTQAGWMPGDLPDWALRCGLERVVSNVGRLAEADVTALLQDATLLVAIDYAQSQSTTLLSKLPDYVSAGRPILALTSASSAMGRFFHEDGAGQVAHYDSPEDIAARIADAFVAWQQQRLDALLPRDSARKAFAPRRVLEELGAAFAAAAPSARMCVQQLRQPGIEAIR
jgi:glycosyltransferase involved in cell wall biosynthesis